MRREVANRAKHLCEYCRIPDAFAPDAFEAEHVTPVCRGGQSLFENLAWACGGCNAFKGVHITGVDPLSGLTVSFFNPRQDAWSDHFAWAGGDSIFIEGITPVGRATVTRLRMNRPGLRNLRLLLSSVGKHPPH